MQHTMGFNPDSIKPREVTYEKVPVDAPREVRVNALAHILHSRGITASLADAKRLAEGMVEGERKVLKDGQPKKDPEEERRKIQSSSAFFSSAGVVQTPTATMRWSPDFQSFIDRSSSLGRPIAPAGPIMMHREEPTTYGRGDDLHTLSSVPHVVHSKQVFFDEAPTLDQTRGFAGQTEHKPKFDPFTYGKNSPVQSAHIIETKSAVRVEEDGENHIIRTEIVSPTVEIVQEEGRIEIDEEKIEKMTEVTIDAPSNDEPENSPSQENEIKREADLPDSTQNTTAETTAPEESPEVEAESIKEETPLVPEVAESIQESFSVEEQAPLVAEETPASVAEEPAPPPRPEPQREDLAKKHGIDLFNMFKVNK